MNGAAAAAGGMSDNSSGSNSCPRSAAHEPTFGGSHLTATNFSVLGLFESALRSAEQFAEGMTSLELMQAHELLGRLDGQLWTLMRQLLRSAEQRELSAGKPASWPYPMNGAAPLPQLPYDVFPGAYAVAVAPGLAPAPPSKVTRPAPAAGPYFGATSGTNGSAVLEPAQPAAGLFMDEEEEASQLYSDLLGGDPAPPPVASPPPAARHSVACRVCGKSFSRSFTVRRHIRAVHRYEEYPEQCARCGGRFVGGPELAQHKCPAGGSPPAPTDNSLAPGPDQLLRLDIPPVAASAPSGHQPHSAMASYDSYFNALQQQKT